MNFLFIAQALYFFLPAYAANMMPVIGRNWLPTLNAPVSKELFGAHKTWQGLILGTAGGILTAGIQHFLVPFLPWLSVAPYDRWFELGLLLGIGAVLGDLIKSYFKRIVGIYPGMSWMPFDQLDFVFGGLLLCSALYFPGWFSAGIIVLLSFFLHIAVNHLGYYLGLRRSPW